jgi:RHS repeat-associated protein
MSSFLSFFYLCQINSQMIMELLRSFYHPDHLGSSSWITDGSGNAIQHLHYLPFGEDWVDQRNSSWNTPYTFSGKEKDMETGYGYFGARYYDSGLSIWLSVDPMSDKYPSMSPYNYCANNPVILVDPDGRIVVTLDEASRTNIINTLTKDEAIYIRFKKDGTLDVKRLMKSKSTSENMLALKELAKSDTKYIFSVADKDLEGNDFFDKGDGKNFYRGVTSIPGNKTSPSPDNDVHIIIYSKLSDEEQAITTAHEAFGHGFFNELKKQNENINVNHTYRTELDENGQCCVGVASNHALENQILKVENQARTNFKSRKK